jgi:type II secretory pathway pseudopilin PulG
MKCRLKKQHLGFAYAILLFALALFSVGAAAIGTAWSDASRRAREAELIHVGSLYAHAIARYHAMSPGSVKTYPTRLGQLLEDPRFGGIERHLRTLYPDPITRQDWRLIVDANGGITGVYSASDLAPLKNTPLMAGELRLTAAQRYSDWKFVPSPNELPKAGS